MVSSLRSINLNLLPILRELLRKRNVTRAAETLNMSQSTVSEALGRIRELLNDEILVQQGRMMVPTAYAERLAAALDETLGGIEAMLLPPTFDSADLKGTMVVATADYVVLTLGPEFVRRVAAEAPELTLQFVNVAHSSLSALRLGELDAAIVPSGVADPHAGEFDNEFLFEDDLVFLVADDGRERPPEELLEGRFAFFCADRDPSSSFEGVVINQLGRQRLDAVRLANFSLIPYFVEHSDNVALIQRSLANRLRGPAAVRIVEPSIPLPKVRLHLFWNKGRTCDPAHAWFRDHLSATARAFRVPSTPGGRA